MSSHASFNPTEPDDEKDDVKELAQPPIVAIVTPPTPSAATTATSTSNRPLLHPAHSTAPLTVHIPGAPHASAAHPASSSSTSIVPSPIVRSSVEASYSGSSEESPSPLSVPSPSPPHAHAAAAHPTDTNMTAGTGAATAPLLTQPATPTSPSAEAAPPPHGRGSDDLTSIQHRRSLRTYWRPSAVTLHLRQQLPLHTRRHLLLVRLAQHPTLTPHPTHHPPPPLTRHHPWLRPALSLLLTLLQPHTRLAACVVRCVALRSGGCIVSS